MSSINIIIIYCKTERKLCVSFCKSVCLSTHSCSNDGAYSFEIWYRDTSKDFSDDLEAIFSKIKLDFLKQFFPFFVQVILYLTILYIYAWYSRPSAPKFGIEILKVDIEKISKGFFQKSF